MTRFSGSVALVTGAARPRSIGRATALRLAADGAAVACLDIARSYDEAPMHGVASSDDLDSLIAEIEASGGRAVAVRADVSDAAAVEAAVDAATAALGTIDLVANVAGGSGPGFGLGPLVALPDSRVPTGVRGQRHRHVADLEGVRVEDARRRRAGPDLQRVEPGRQEGVADDRRLLGGEGGGHLDHAGDGDRARPIGDRRQRRVPGHGRHEPGQSRTACS